ncbi:MAG: oligosaccharide flippase family protein [Cyanobacteria bacterium RM1_2_2]|nr:oligosaccharide flippase family protein [Cyanobacteria bacterium RM1_2_2]
MSSTTETEKPSVSKLAVRGAVWTIIGYGASQTLRFGSNLILTRLLVPELFGLMALVYVFITGLNMFSDVGIGFSIVQNKRGDDRNFLNTAWTIQVARGMVLWLGCLALAYPVSQLYEEPRLLWLIPLVGLNTIVAGFNSTAVFTLNRHLRVREMAFYEFSGQLLGTTVIIIWAWVHPSIWALVAGGIITPIYQLILSYFLNHFVNKDKPNRFLWDQTAAKEILSFGIWIFLSTAMTFFGENADRLILGKMLGFKLLGIYGIAVTFADLPRSITAALSGKVVMPAISKIADQSRATVRIKIARKRKLILFVIAVGLAGLVSFGDLIIETLYDERYEEAAWMLPILALGIWPRLLCNTIEPALFAIGKPQYTTLANISRFTCTAVGIQVGYSMFGLVGAVGGVALNDLCYYLVVLLGVWREELSNIKHDLLATALLLATIAVLLKIRLLIGVGLPIDALLQA